jgi:quinol monooxygenase YgiN
LEARGIRLPRVDADLENNNRLSMRRLRSLQPLFDEPGIALAKNRDVILISLRMTVAARQKEELIQALSSLLRPARAEKGFICGHLALDVFDSNALIYEERWQTNEDLEVQLQSARFGMLLALMKTAAERPSLEFHFVSASAREFSEPSAVLGRRRIPDQLEYPGPCPKRRGWNGRYALLKQDKMADEFVATMNRAAQQAVLEAADTFTGAVKNMSFDDARSIFTGTKER